ncbi:hypothetical protein Vretimale_15556 [Volvox reticuliferus]|uniref:Uncharacterized protein n=2 Tax=Volvox reticuliferus TaxID=1737510 RepID=A0A8J4GP92_9CHLO|nr:hypothetical protein Vretimale_15556 [Volvox reticuliferus]
MASETGCADLLAGLAQEYERSRAFLEQLEGDLQVRASLTVVAATAPVRFSCLPTPLEAEERDEEAEEEAREENAPNMPNKGLPKAPRKTGSLRAKLSSFFSRNRSLAPRDMDQCRGELKPRVSFVELHGVTTPAEPPRFLSFHPMGANGALHPTSALLRQGTRASLDVSKQQQPEISDGVAPRRLSTSNLGGLQQATVSRRSIDPFSAAGRRLSIEVTKIRPATQSNFEITAAGRSSNGQLSVVGASSGGGTTPITISSPWHHHHQQPVDTYATAPTTSGQLLMAREDSMRRRSISRRASDRASSPCAVLCANFNTNPQLLLGSPVGSPTHSSCLSPGATLTAGLPALLPAYGSQGASNCGNPSSIFLRPHSMSSVLTVSTGVHDEQQPVGLSGLASPVSDRCAVSATGMVNPVAAVGHGVASSGDIVQQLQLPLLPARSRSLQAPRMSSLVASGGSPKVAAAGMEPRRLQSFRFADSIVCASVSSPGSGARDDEPSYDFGAANGKDLAPVISGSKFQGTMHLI